MGFERFPDASLGETSGVRGRCSDLSLQRFSDAIALLT